VNRGRAQAQAYLSLYQTAARPCAYLPDRMETVQFVDPRTPMNGTLYQTLMDKGFRRAGAYVYRPACAACRSCIPLRLAVADFVPNRSQRRNQRRNSDLSLHQRPALFDPQHFALYAAYLRHRHPEGDMARQVTAQSYRDYLIQPWGGETRLLELRMGPRLLALAVTDFLPSALSAVYTFYDPTALARAPGVQAILRQISLAHYLGFDYLYLGYWIGDCRRMNYKDHYRPLQALIQGQWRQFGPGEPLPAG